MEPTLIHSARLVTAHEDVSDAWVLLANGVVADRGAGSGWHAAAEAAGATVVDAEGLTLVPGFIDLHCHGGAAADYGDDDRAAVQAALQLHRTRGTTRTVMSLVTAPLDKTAERVARIRALTEAGTGVLGSHLEGPFLAEEFKGAHDPTLLREADGESVGVLLAAAGGTIAQVTIAPELEGSPEAIRQLVDAGVVVAVGHTATDYAGAKAAFDAGATLLTHAFNGMRGIHHRAPGPVVAAMSSPGVTLEVINDGVHVHPDVVNMAFASAPGRIALVTDAMAATGCADGDYMLGTLAVEVKDGVARLVEGGSIAGSTLTLDVALRQTVEQCGVPLAAAIGALTATPARVLGVDDRLGDLRVGYAADAVLLSPELTVEAVWAAGERVLLAAA